MAQRLSDGDRSQVDHMSGRHFVSGPCTVRSKSTWIIWRRHGVRALALGVCNDAITRMKSICINDYRITLVQSRKETAGGAVRKCHVNWNEITITARSGFNGHSCDHQSIVEPVINKPLTTRTVNSNLIEPAFTFRPDITVRIWKQHVETRVHQSSRHWQNPAR